MQIGRVWILIFYDCTNADRRLPSRSLFIDMKKKYALPFIFFVKILEVNSWHSLVFLCFVSSEEVGAFIYTSWNCAVITKRGLQVNYYVNLFELSMSNTPNPFLCQGCIFNQKKTKKQTNTKKGSKLMFNLGVGFYHPKVLSFFVPYLSQCWLFNK